MKFTHRIKTAYAAGVQAYKRSKDENESLDEALTVWPWEDDPDGNNPLKIATVYRCVRLLSESVAQLPLAMFEIGADGIRRPVAKGMLPYLLAVEPMESFTPYEYWRQCVQQLICLGNAYILVQRSQWSGEAERLMLLSPGSCTYDTVRRVYVVNDYVRGVRGEFAREEMIHLRGMSRDGEVGVSVLEFARVAAATASARNRSGRHRPALRSHGRRWSVQPPASSEN